MSLRSVIVHLAENDDFGLPCGKVVAVHFADSLNYDTLPELELESSFVAADGLDGPTCERVDGALLIGGDVYPVSGFRPHVGNLAWNGYAMLLSDAQRLAAHLTRRHGFTVDAEDDDHPFFSDSVRS